MVEHFDGEEPIEVTRQDLFDFLATVGAPLPDRTSTAQLKSAFRRAVNRLPDSLDEIRAELAKPCSDRRRGQLTWRRIELERAEQAAATRKPPVVGNLIVFAPDGLGTLLLSNGREVALEIINGRPAFRLFLAEFVQLAAHDSRWNYLNPEINRLG